MSEPDSLKTSLLASRERLLAAIAGVTEEQFKRRPEGSLQDAQRWSIAEILAHLLATQRLWATRIETALSCSDTRIEACSAGWNDEQAHSGRFAPVPQLVHGLLASHRALERLIGRAGEAPGGLDLAIEHSTRGRLTVLEMIERFSILVTDEHAARIEALRSAVGARAV